MPSHFRNFRLLSEARKPAILALATTGTDLRTDQRRVAPVAREPVWAPQVSGVQLRYTGVLEAPAPYTIIPAAAPAGVALEVGTLEMAPVFPASSTAFMAMEYVAPGVSPSITRFSIWP